MLYKIRSLLILFIVSQLILLGALVLTQQNAMLVAIIFGSAAIAINTFLLMLVWNKLIKPLKDVSSSNTDASFVANLNTDIGAISGEIKEALSASNSTTQALHQSVAQSGQLVNAIEDDLRALDSYSEHMIAPDAEIGFEPKQIEQAFAQSISAADYATSTFEQIYMSISNLGQGYNTVRSQSTELQQSASAAQTQVVATKNNVTKLSLAASEINEVTKSISDIASMTQLLALNASIEAARAGESGRGFAVVADEVKKLASQTDKATKRISDISNGILSSSQESEESIDKIDELTKDINQIITAVFSEVENQWGDVQQLLGKMGQAAGTVSGLKGILMASDNELQGHFIMLEGVYQFAQESSKTIKQLSERLGVSLGDSDALEAVQQDAEVEIENDNEHAEKVVSETM
jgi:methyl-accepting chemotaxis protein